MRINDGSICADCGFFEHECDIPCGYDDWYCEEYCNSKDECVVNEFINKNKPIKKCKDFNL